MAEEEADEEEDEEEEEEDYERGEEELGLISVMPPLTNMVPNPF